MRYAEKCLQSATRSSSCAAGVPIHLRIFHIRFCSCHQLPCTHEWAPSCATCALCHGGPVPWIRNHMRGLLQSKTTHVYQEIICLSRVSRQHMSIFAKAYIWRKLVVSPWKIVKNWLYPSSHISTYITYINLYTLENCDIKLLPIRSKKNRPRRSTSAETSDPWAVAVSQEI